jgi:GGDEF domain-containing protein
MSDPADSLRSAGHPQPEAADEDYSSGNVLEDLLLQAEIFVQYGMKPRALERAERIARQFPGEEQHNDRLRALYAALQFSPAAAAAPAEPRVQVAQAEEPPDDAIVDVTRVSEITRNIYRQSSVKTVLSTAVNEIGRAWRASRSVAGFCLPGKPPSAAVEYYAPGMTQSDVKSIVLLITTLVATTSDGNPLAVEDAPSSPKLKALAPAVSALDIRSLLALPMAEAGEVVGVLVLEQCGRSRKWRANDITVLKALIEQVIITASHTRLRSMMRSLALADEQSGLLARNSYLDCLLAECVRGQKQKTPLSVMLLRFDFGASSSQEQLSGCMQEASRALAGRLRQNDILVSYDSATLAVVMPDTSGKDALVVVDKVRKAAGTLRAGGAAPPLAAGVAEALLGEVMELVDCVTEVINRVEEALDSAQHDGTCSSTMLPPPDKGGPGP